MITGVGSHRGLSVSIAAASVASLIDGTLLFGISAGTGPENGSAGAVVRNIDSRLGFMVMFDISALKFTVVRGVLDLPFRKVPLDCIGCGSVEVMTSDFCGSRESLGAVFGVNGTFFIRGSDLAPGANGTLVSYTFSISSNGTVSVSERCAHVCVYRMYNA